MTYQKTQDLSYWSYWETIVLETFEFEDFPVYMFLLFVPYNKYKLKALLLFLSMKIVKFVALFDIFYSNNWRGSLIIDQKMLINYSINI